MKLKELSELTFATANPEEMDLKIVQIVEQLLDRKLGRADPLRLFLRGIEAIIIQQRLLIDQTAKQNLLAYATGENLDHLGALVGCERLSASSAITTVIITLSTARAVSTTIKKGTRITADDTIFFALDEDVIFLAGETEKESQATCTTVGENGNGFLPNELNKIVDPQPFLLSITNKTVSENGSDIESDDAYRERIHEAPEAFSCAGSEGAYIYHTKSVSPLIVDVSVDSDEPGNVQVYPLLADGQLPGSELLKLISDHLNAKTIRPLTDNVFVVEPLVVYYDIDLKYWISRSDAISASEINDLAGAAVTEYVSWQREKLGRDINPSELIFRLKKIGVKRVEITLPKFTITDKKTVAIAREITATFEGLEDD